MSTSSRTPQHPVNSSRLRQADDGSRNGHSGYPNALPVSTSAPASAFRQRIGRYNKRAVRPLVTINELFLTLGGGQRMDVLSALARGAITVTKLAERLFLPVHVVSRELAMLEQRGLVVWEREGNYRWYRLSRHVVSAMQGEIVQLGIQVESGHWIVVHLNESGEHDHSMPPCAFIA